MFTGRNIMRALLLTVALIYFGSNAIIHSQNSYRFDNINQKQGLSQGTINDIFEDSNGLMWFATKDGLNRYDGKQIKVYRRNHNDPNSLPNNHILALNEDSEGRLWIGTLGNNLCYLDPVTDEFYSYKTLLKVNDPTKIGENVYSIAFDSVQQLLYAGSNTGILQLDLKAGSLEFWDTQHLDFDGFEIGNIRSLLLEDKQLWVGTDRCGLLLFDIETEIFTPIKYSHNRINNEANLNRGIILDLLKDTENTIWAAGYGKYVLKLDREKLELNRPNFKAQNKAKPEEAYNFSLALVGDTAIWSTTEYGFQIFDLKRKTVQNIYHFPDNFQDLLSYGFKSIKADLHGGIWLGGNGYGISYYFPYNKGFKHISYQPTAITGLTFKSVRSIYKDPGGMLYIGGYGGLNAFDTNGIRKWKSKATEIPYIIHPDPVYPELLWIGTEGDRIMLIDKTTGLRLPNNYKNIRLDPEKIHSINMMSILDKNADELLIGTENSLYLLHKKTGETSRFIHNPADSFSIPDGGIRELFTDSKNRTWLASLGGGLAYMHDNDMRFKTFRHQSENTTSISSNIVYCIFETNSGEIYIGTENGMNRFDEQTNSFENFNTSDGLANDVVYRIESDELGRLWLSTNQGLSCFDPKTKKFRNYEADDGLQDNEFNSGASFKDENNRLYFGGINGVSTFKIQDLRDNKIAPKILFTKLLVGGEPLIIDPPITRAKEVKLEYDNQAFYLEFAALNYYKPQKNQYTYRIVEISENWHNLGNTNSIELIRLGYGKYTIEVTGANNDNYWNTEPAKLIINIKRPFWATHWFITLTILIIILLFSTIYLLRLRSLRRKKESLEKEVALRTDELLLTNDTLKQEVATRKKTEIELKEANNTKDKFFSIIAHDLKNPFNVLLGLSEILDTDFDILDNTERKEIVSALRKSTDDLYRLLENLLSWSRAQQGILKMKPAKIRISEIVDENIRLLKTQANTKKIAVSSTVNPELFAKADYNAITTVIRNLLSNAIKFTDKGGDIFVTSEEIGPKLSISITDNGVGIEAANMDKLFSIDEQFKRKGTMHEKGTGLGLAICKEFTEANKGTLTAESVYGKGSTFTVTLPKA